LGARNKTRLFDRDGKPITFLAHPRLFEDPKYRFLAKTRINGVCITTIWLGLSYEDDRPVGIFETMAVGNIQQEKIEIDTTGMDPFSAYLHEWVSPYEDDEIIVRSDTEVEAMDTHKSLIAKFS